MSEFEAAETPQPPPQAQSAVLQDAGPRGVAIIVYFDDGHWMVFHPNYNAAGEADAIEEISLITPTGAIVANFFSPFQNPVRRTRRNQQQGESEYGFDWRFVPYGLSRITDYLACAWLYLREVRTDLWPLICGSNDLVVAVINGEYPVPD